MPHDDVYDNDLSMRTRMMYAANSVRLAAIHLPKRNNVEEAVDLNVQADSWRKRRHPEWRQIVSFVRENPFLAFIAILFAPLAVVVYLFRFKKSS